MQESLPLKSGMLGVDILSLYNSNLFLSSPGFLSDKKQSAVRSKGM